MTIRPIFLFIVVVLAAGRSFAFMNYTLSDSGATLPANSVIDIRSDGSSVWVGSSDGVARSSDGGETWITFGTSDSLRSSSISGLAVRPGLVWVATSRSEIREGELIPIGTGLSRTLDSGANWTSYGPEQANYYGKLAYDLEITDSAVWAACFYGGLIRSGFNDTTFFNVFPDSASRAQYDSAGFATAEGARFFSVKADTSHPDSTVIFGGSAWGIYRFIFFNSDSLPDTVFHYFSADTTVAPGFHLPGDFVISLGVQYLPSGSVIWAACKPVRSGEVAVTRSTDDGQSWITTDASIGFECWNFAFDDTIVYAATTQGLVRTEDNGATWTSLGGFVDYVNGNLYLSPTFYAVEVQGDTLWGGGPDGVVRTTDGGSTWRIFRSYLPAGSPDAGDSYAYPVPFSPDRGSGYVRIHYRAPSSTRADIKIYDFAMNLVATVASGKQLTADKEYDNDVWDGRNGKGDRAANGVYFYRIKMDDGTDWWGKLAVLK